MNIRRAFLALGAMILGVGLLGASPAFAGQFGALPPEAHTDIVIVNGIPTPNTVTCRNWIKPPSNDFPADTVGHYWVCSSTLHPTVVTSRADVAVNPVTALNTNAPLWSFLTTHNIVYYYFPTRDDAILFFSGKFPGGVLGSGPGPTVNTDSRCGNTGSPPGSSFVYVQIYDECKYNSLSGITEPNPNLGKTAAHETGHAFDFAYGKAHGGTPISQSPGFKGLAGGLPGVYSGDIFYITPINWLSLPSNTQRALICNRFKANLFPSNFEVSTGVFSEAVCAGGNVVRDNTSIGGHNFQGMDPLSIANLRIPYFLTTGPGAGNLYAELFAEQFAKHFNSVPGTDFLEMTDFALNEENGFPCKDVGGTYSCPGVNYPAGAAFHCTSWVVREFFFTALPPPANMVAHPGNPTQNSLKAKGCPDLAPSQFN